jgi:hypothetical protein
MSLIEKYIVLAVVVWRLTHLVGTEDGPFDSIIKLRKAAGDSFLGKLMDCFYCLSIWIGLLAASYSSSNFNELILFTLYYSGAAIVLEKLINKNFV